MSVLSLALPGVVSWRRPRKEKGRRRADGTWRRGGQRYPEAYELARDAWTRAVESAVTTQGWTPPAGARFGVEARITGRGSYDPDRVQTAVLDCLQFGGALPGDHRKWIGELHLYDRRAARGEPAQTAILVWPLAASDKAAICHEDAPRDARATQSPVGTAAPRSRRRGVAGTEKGTVAAVCSDAQ